MCGVPTGRLTRFEGLLRSEVGSRPFLAEPNHLLESESFHTKTRPRAVGDGPGGVLCYQNGVKEILKLPPTLRLALVEGGPRPS